MTRLLMARLRSAHRQERGDVPGWVLITVMTAGLVAALTAAVSGPMRQMVVNALQSVGG